jgi:hypothetical protein
LKPDASDSRTPSTASQGDEDIDPALPAGKLRPSVLSTPIICSVALPFMLLDLWVTAYQWICFPIYRIPHVRRADYMALDRRKLSYLNGIEKANCDCCGYANGLLAYVREVTARTGQYWSLIKHARRAKGAHSHHRDHK